MSQDRVYKSMFYGSKHIDQYVPKTDPRPRVDQMAGKQAEWSLQNPPQVPTSVADMYKTTSLASSGAFKGEKYTINRLGGL